MACCEKILFPTHPMAQHPGIWHNKADTALKAVNRYAFYLRDDEVWYWQANGRPQLLWLLQGEGKALTEL